MKYEPTLPTHNDNIGHEHPLKDFLLIFAGVAAAVLAGFFLLGLLVDVAVDHMSPDTEAALGRIAAPRLTPGDPALAAREAQLQALVDSLRPCAGIGGPVTVRLMRSPVPNAFVVPGGAIYLFTGLLGQVKSENGLAFVLAHELAHGANRDHLRAMGRGIVLFSLAALAGADGASLANLMAPVQRIGESSYSRGREAAADAAALQTLNCRYGHAGGATELFIALKHQDDKHIAGTHYLASHPSMQSRIDALESAIRDGGMKRGAVTPLLLP